LKKTLLSLIPGCLLFTACQKDLEAPPQPTAPVIAENCILQTVNPDGKSYPLDSLKSFDCTGKYCAVMPLSTKNYWVYQDSIFNNGTFVKVENDTLRFTETYKTNDGLTWWESNIPVGLPERFYANDSSFFKIEERMFIGGILDVRREFGLFPGDSLRYLANFEDAAAVGRLLKVPGTYSSPAGNFTDCIYFDKNARNFQHDQLWFKPGIGVVKYIQEKAPMGTPFVKLQRISTLLKYHFE